MENNLKVQCPVCQKYFNQITWRHLSKHNLTIKEFQKQYSSYPLINPEVERINKQLRKEAKEKVNNKKVEKPCWNFDNCKNYVEVNVNVSNTSVTCNDCRDNNLFHPKTIKHKQKLSKLARTINKDPEILKKRNNSLRNRSKEQLEKTKIKREKTLIKTYGKDWKDIQLEKTKKGMLKKYDVEFALQKEKFQKKAKQTYKDKTGYNHPMENPYIKNLIQEYNKEHQNEITQKAQSTNLKRYGNISPFGNKNIIQKSKNTRFLKQKERINNFLNEMGFILLNEYKHAHDKVHFKHIDCGYKWETCWNNFWNSAQNGNPCPNCKPKNTNNKITQNKIQDFLEKCNLKPLVENRVFLEDGRELDFIIVDKKVAIEYCGLFWHNEKILEDTRKKFKKSIKEYHKSKLEICESKGYQLITIFEDEWLYKKDIVKSRLKQILNINDSIRIHARNCIIKKITNKEKNNFLNNFHLQGSHDNSILYYGAYYNNELISIMTFGKPRGKEKFKNGDWELKRFCSDFNYHIPGIASKLLKYFQKNNHWVKIISYADRRWSNGNLYYKLGFKLENTGVVSPWYVDVNKVKRYHRSTIWKSKEEKNSGLTQDQISILKGYKIIWDCGNLKFVLKSDQQGHEISHVKLIKTT